MGRGRARGEFDFLTRRSWLFWALTATVLGPWDRRTTAGTATATRNSVAYLGCCPTFNRQHRHRDFPRSFFYSQAAATGIRIPSTREHGQVSQSTRVRYRNVDRLDGSLSFALDDGRCPRPATMARKSPTMLMAHRFFSVKPRSTSTMAALTSPNAMSRAHFAAAAISATTKGDGSVGVSLEHIRNGVRSAAIAAAPVVKWLWALVWRALQVIAPSKLELTLCSRLMVAAMLGMAIGLERRTSHRPAGVRTMGLVAMGACTFTLMSQYGFVGKADQARVAASVASGVGFIGAGVITTSGKDSASRTSRDNDNENEDSGNDGDGDVRGLTTASAIWITAGLGMACGAGLFFTALSGAILTVSVLKISRVTQIAFDKMSRVQALVRPELASQIAAAKAAEKAAVIEAAEAEKRRVEKEKKKAEKKVREAEEEAERNAKIIAKQKEEERILAAEQEERLGGREEVENGEGRDGDVLEDEENEGDDEGGDEDDVHDDDDSDGSIYYMDDPFAGSVWLGQPPQQIQPAAAGDAPERTVRLVPPVRRTLKRSRVLPSRAQRRKMVTPRGLYMMPRTRSDGVAPDTPGAVPPASNSPQSSGSGNPIPGTKVRQESGDLDGSGSRQREASREASVSAISSASVTSVTSAGDAQQVVVDFSGRDAMDDVPEPRYGMVAYDEAAAAVAAAVRLSSEAENNAKNNRREEALGFVSEDDADDGTAGDPKGSVSSKREDSSESDPTPTPPAPPRPPENRSSEEARAELTDDWESANDANASDSPGDPC